MGITADHLGDVVSTIASQITIHEAQSFDGTVLYHAWRQNLRTYSANGIPHDFYTRDMGEWASLVVVLSTKNTGSKGTSNRLTILTR
eukprot:scaffold23287_cov175-Amphora_coffeaeformis.AAC.5